ncbi:MULTISPECIES: hypothetical protein [Nostocales]|uniref:Bacteriocin n=3 Tax=Nostocales TaxID=1161 RepID=A0A0C1NCT9_9CYAN
MTVLKINELQIEQTIEELSDEQLESIFGGVKAEQPGLLLAYYWEYSEGGLFASPVADYGQS